MNKKKILIIVMAIAFLGVTSCAQKVCSAYAKVDKEEKKEKKEGQF
ncbi:hypothetical protein [Roseivirga misakiensis]|nr:hypothetical protein [Roseivirga misakiensis]